MKICLTCADGGHLTEMQQLLDAFEGHEIFFITYKGERSKKLNHNYFITNISDSKFKFLFDIPKIFYILLIERPKLIVSTGSEIAIPTFYFGKLLGCRLIFIETICRITQPTVTGRIVYPICDLFLVQQEELLKKYGKKAKYEGGVY